MRLYRVLVFGAALVPVGAQQVVERQEVSAAPPAQNDAGPDAGKPAQAAGPKAKASKPEKREVSKEARAKAKELLDKAYDSVSAASPAVQVSALIHLAEDYQLVDSKKAVKCLDEAFAAAGALPSDSIEDTRVLMQSEIVKIAANLDLEKAISELRQITPPPNGRYDRRLEALDKIVAVLMQRKELGRAMQVVDGFSDSGGGYPYRAVGAILKAMPEDDPVRGEIFAKATSAFSGKPDNAYLQVLARHWRTLPRGLVESAMKTVLAYVLERPEGGPMLSTFSSAKGAVSFDNRQDAELFDLMNIIQTVDSKRAAELLQQRPKLRLAVEQYPLGRQSLEGENGGGVSQSMSQSGKDGKQDPRQAARMQIQAISRAKAGEAMAAASSDPQKALSLAEQIPDSAVKARTLAMIARSASGKDPSAAKAMLDKCARLLDSVKEPMERVTAWDGMAEAAHNAQDDELAWAYVNRWLSDAADLYKNDSNADDPNRGLREYWPSTQTYRAVVYRTAAMFESDAEALLAKITDPDLQLLATVEMAHSLLGQDRTGYNINISKGARR